MITFNELRVDTETKEIIVDASIDRHNKDIVIDSVIIDTQNTYIPDGPSNQPVYVKHFFEGDPSSRRVRLYISQAELGTPIAGNIFFVYIIASHINEITKKRSHFSTWSMNNENFNGCVGDSHIHFSEIRYGNVYLIAKANATTVIKVSGLKDGQHLFFGSLDEEDTETINILKDGIYPISTSEKFRGFYTDFVGECDIDIQSLSEGFVYLTEEGVDISCTGIKRVGTVVDMMTLYRSAMAYVKDLQKKCGNYMGFADWILRLNAFELAIKTGNYSTAIDFWNKYLSGNESNSSEPSKLCCCHG